MSALAPISRRFAPRTVADPLASRLALAGGGAFAMAAVLLGVLHLDRRWGGGINPVTAMLSDYGLAPGWWMWDLALVLTSTGSLAVLVALRRTELLGGWTPVSFLVLWCVAMDAVAVFTKDPQGGAVTFTGKLHLYATGIGCAALPLAGLALARRHRGHPQWRRFAAWTRYLSLSSVPFFLPFIIPFVVNVLFTGQRLPTVATGLVERIMAVLELCLLGVLALWARRAVSFPPTAGADPDRMALRITGSAG
jgi:hypothetical protein